MRKLVFVCLTLTFLLLPGSAFAQAPNQSGDTSGLNPAANPAAVAMRDLGDNYRLFDFDTQHPAASRTDFSVAYVRFDEDVITPGPLFVEMRLIVFNEQPQSVIDSEMATYLTSGAPELTAISGPSGLERFQWFSVDDDLFALSGYATLFPVTNGFASIAALDEDEVKLDDLARIARSAAANLFA